MTAAIDEKETKQSRLNRPSLSAPSVDRPWEHPFERQSRLAFMKRDLSQHRVYHSLCEDMLN